ncbi:MAG: hypothetical protein FJ267_19405, partial [Planctomycetes bacterium]|nr:hypothetical protein [Planctomycetota bacterium]
MKAFGMLIGMVGVTLIFVGQRMFWRRLLARIRGCILEGEIVKWTRIRIRGPMESSAHRQKFQPVVKFVDPTGIERTLELDYQYTTTYQKEHPVGSKHPVLFDPVHPERPCDTSWTMSYFL